MWFIDLDLLSDTILRCMPKITTEYFERLSFRVPSALKSDLLEINSEYSSPAREAIEQYLPIKKLMQNPLAIPRHIGESHTKIHFSVNSDGKFEFSIGENRIPLDLNDLKVLMANVYMFTLNAEEV